MEMSSLVRFQGRFICSPIISTGFAICSSTYIARQKAVDSNILSAEYSELEFKESVMALDGQAMVFINEQFLLIQSRTQISITLRYRT
jgi:hypothetical protein